MFNMGIKKELSCRTEVDVLYPCCVAPLRAPGVWLIIKYEDDNPLHVETQKDFNVVCNRDTDAFCKGIS